MTISALVSIGYQGRDIDDLVTQLIANKVNVLVDVRLTPLSRKPGLSKRRLAERLESEGIRYIHTRALGNPKENRDGFRAGLRSSLEIFAQHIEANDAAEAIQHIAELMDGEVVALLCFEREHQACHRHIVAKSVLHRVPEAPLLEL
ncbi:hypothetical protein BH09ACT10_BH09ACT10_06510 [soil metagenome]